MNETLKTILSRRSIRAFKQEQIKEEELKAILQAGSFAPSAMNQQSWHFTVIQNKELLQKINEFSKAVLIKIGNKAFEARSKNTPVEKINIMYNAPTLIIVSGDIKAIAPQNDASLAIENMFLAAESLRIGSCWLHTFNVLFSTEEGKDFLIKQKLIPEGYVPVGSGVFGYKDVEASSPAPRREGIYTFFR